MQKFPKIPSGGVQGWVKMEENHFSVSYSNGYPDGSASGLFIIVMAVTLFNG
jgi:hypothetical protein